MLRFDAERLRARRRPARHRGDRTRAARGRGSRRRRARRIRETPLITAASYGDADVARELIAAGADLEALAAPDAGGVPGGTALLHAAVFGMTPVLDVLVAAGARIRGIEEAAAAGDLCVADPRTRLRSRRASARS